MKRQIVFIMTDTQGTNVLGCYGHPELRTPRLDRLAAEGIRFDRAYTCQPVCGPARAALFTGQFPHTAGSWANSMPLGEITRTIGQRLQAADIQKRGQCFNLLTFLIARVCGAGSFGHASQSTDRI